MMPISWSSVVARGVPSRTSATENGLQILTRIRSSTIHVNNGTGKEEGYADGKLIFLQVCWD